MQHSGKAPIPANVPTDRVVEFNVYDPEGGKTDLHGAWRKLQQTGRDIVWCPYNGGHWLPLRFDDIDFMQRNHDPFSMRDVGLPSGMKPSRLLPLESDPPEHLGFRMIINPFFTPRKMGELEHFTRDLALGLIEEIQPRGRCEFMEDFALKLPIAIFMRLADLPMEDASELLAYAEMSTRGGPELQVESQNKMLGYIMPVIERRQKEPGQDLLSAIIHSKVRGEPIAQADMISTVFTVLFGGLDTVGSTLGFIAHFLAGSPSHRRQLIDDPSLIPLAANELMRRFAPSNTARTLARDYEYKGLQFKEGDKVYISNLLSGLDETHFTNAWEVDFRRSEGEHAGFGAGPHRCPGQLLALLEIRTFLEEWLKRIPDFEISKDDPPRFGPGQVNCVSRLVLEWNV
jgi:cytochrome P450